MTIAADKSLVTENEGAAGFTLTRTGSTAAALPVTVAVTQEVDRDLLPDGAAAARTVMFAVGSATAALSVELENDDLLEARGELTVEVRAGSGYTVGDPGSATVDVTDVDTGLPTPANLMAEAGAGVGEVELSWDAYTPGLEFSRHQYRYKTDGDYPAEWMDIPNSGQNNTLAGDGSNLTGYTVIGLVGGQSYTFEVRTFSPRIDDPDRTSDPSDEATATPRSAVVSFGAGSYSVDEGGTVEVTVQLDAAPGRAVVVPVSAAGAGGATPPGETGADWSGVPENVTFGATDTAQTFTLTATDDTDVDAGESVALSFGTLPDWATAGTPSEATVTIVDNDAADAVNCTLNTGDLWCGTVTVGTSSDGVGFVAADPDTDPDVGALTDNSGDQTITIGSDSYTISSLLVRNSPVGALSIDLDESFPTDDVATLEFYIGTSTKTFKVSEATAYAIDFGYFWTGSGLTWSDGAEVTVRLRRAAEEEAAVVTIEADSDTNVIIEEAGTVDFTLSRTGSTAAALPVTVAVTQQVDRDILPDGAAAVRTVTFAVGSAMAALSVTLDDDDLDDVSGTLTVEVRAGSGYTVGDPGSATVDVTDIDTGLPTPANLMAEAGAGAGVGEVELSWDAYTPGLEFSRHQYRYKTDGDYPAEWTDIPNSGQNNTLAGDGSNLTGHTVIGLVGGQSHTFQVRTFSPRIDDPDRTSDPSDEATATPRSAAVSFGAGSYSVDEGGTVEVTVQLDAAPGREVVVPVSAAGAGGATPPGETGADWSGVPESVTFGATDTEQTFTLAATDDTDVETGESVTLSFGTLPDWATAGTPSEVTVTIVDADVPVLPTLSVANAAAAESDGVTFTVTLSAAATTDVTATWTASIESGDTAEAEDLGSTTGTVTVMESQTTAMITVPTVGDPEDTTDEDDETFTLTLSNPSANATLAADATATGTINDDDDPPTISVEDQTVNEFDQNPDNIVEVEAGFPFLVTLSAASEKQVRFRVRRVELASDTATDADLFTNSNLFLGLNAIKPGVAVDNTEAYVIRNDALDEPDETFTLEIYDFENATAGAKTRSTITIEDDDDPPSVSVGDATAAEGAPMEFPVTLSAASGKTVTVGWATSVETDDSATSPADFTAESGTLTFMPGETTATFTVQTTGDTTDEDNETFTVTLSTATNATLATDPTATGTITDVLALPTLSVANAAAAESAGVTFTVTLSEAATDAVTATWTASIESGDSAEAEDLGSTTGTVTVMESQTTGTFTVPTAGDTDTTDEDNETFTVTLSGVSSNATLASDATATGTITDDDDPPSVSVGDEEAAEGAPVEFPVTLSAASGKTVTVGWATSVETGDSATSGTDFTAASGTLTFMPDETTAMITVQTADDTTDEDDETFTLTLSNATNATLATDPTATGTITDVPALPTLSVADARAFENRGVTFTVTLSEAATTDVTATWTASIESGDTAEAEDFESTTGPVTVTPSETTVMITVLTVDDTTDEDDETFTLTLSGVSSNATLATDATATGTINDNDLPPSISVEDQTVNEGDQDPENLLGDDLGDLNYFPFRVTLSAASERQVRYKVRRVALAGDTATDADFRSMSRVRLQGLFPGGYGRLLRCT